MTIKGDYIPRSDAEFDLWLRNFTTTLNQEKHTLKLADEDLSVLEAARAAWVTKYSNWTTKRGEADAARQAKDDAREEVEAAVRARVRLIQADDTVPDATRHVLGLPVHLQTRTPTPAPTTRPVVQVDAAQRLRHTINFTDEATPNSRRKPDGVRGCEIWVKVGGPAPADPAELRFLALDSATPYVVEYDGAEAGQVAHYMARWLSTRGEPGPWSQTASVTITG
ncbi:MAG TPA: hypothetical protein VF546_19895 [Pyrinomonadaceae bacterium]|jgi:hypothetical protein